MSNNIRGLRTNRSTQLRKVKAKPAEENKKTSAGKTVREPIADIKTPQPPKAAKAPQGNGGTKGTGSSNGGYSGDYNIGTYTNDPEVGKQMWDNARQYGDSIRNDNTFRDGALGGYNAYGDSIQNNHRGFVDGAKDNLHNFDFDLNGGGSSTESVIDEDFFRAKFNHPEKEHQRQNFQRAKN